MAKDDNGLPTKIFPEKIKKIILQNKFVDKCEIITVDDLKNIKKPIAYIVLKEDVELTQEVKGSIQQLCINYLENYTQPAEYKFISNIPLTAGLKSDIKALEKQYEESQMNPKIKLKKK